MNRWVLAPGVWEESKAELFLCPQVYLGPAAQGPEGPKGQKGNMGKNHFSVHLFPHSFIQ